MIIPAAQPLHDDDIGILNGYIEPVGDKLYLRKRSGFTAQTSGVPTMASGDYIVTGGVLNTQPVYIMYDQSAPAQFKLWHAGTELGNPGSAGSTYRPYIDQLDGTGIILNANSGIPGYTFTSTTLTSFSGSLPPNTISSGGATLNGRVYAGDRENGRIYNSAEGDATTWGANDFIATRRPISTTPDDSLRHIHLHQHNIAAFTRYGIDFYYDNANPSGSPLRRREDVMYDIGVFYTQTVDDLGGDLFFVGGRSNSGVVDGHASGVYKITNFALTKVSTPAVDNYIAQTGDDTLIGKTVSYFNSRRPLYVLSRVGSTEWTLVYDIDLGVWYKWKWQTGDAFKVVAQVNAQGSYGLVFRDGTVTTGYTASDVYQDSATNFKFGFVTQSDWLGTKNRKVYKSAAVLSDYTSTGNWSIRYREDDTGSWSTARTTDATGRGVLYNLGSGYKRGWDVSITANTDARIEGLDVDVMAAGA